MDYTSFSHGQTLSKIWLCEQLEPFIPKNSRVAVIGSWYNVMAFIMLTRHSELYQYILGVDINPEATEIAEHICDAWRFGVDKKVSNITADSSTFNINEFNVVINCSVEHMSDSWYEQVVPGSLVCMQSSNLAITSHPWLITNANLEIETLTKKYPLSQTLFLGEKEFNYDTWGYKRFMLIGIK